MQSCSRCKDELSNPDANYCGNCSLPILNGLSEGEVREQAREELSGFLDGFDVRTIRDTMSGEQKEPNEPYQWYLEEGVRKTLTELAFLQRWDWFEKGAIPGLFLQMEIFDDDPSEEAMNDYLLWARVSAFLYEAFQPAGLELSIRLGALLVEDIDSSEDIDVSISIGPDDSDAEGDSDISGPAS